MPGTYNTEEIRQYITGRLPGCRVTVTESTGSTNSDLKAAAENGAPEGTVLIAREQTAGRGRLGRSFYSPKDTGLYMSVILRPRISARECVQLTVCAAAAVSLAADSVFSVRTGIKWVNDIYLDGKKICGILTESALTPGGGVKYCVVGIGINISTSVFPEEIAGAAGAVASGGDAGSKIPQLAGQVLERFRGYYQSLGSREYLGEYRSRSILGGKTVSYVKNGERCAGVVVGIDDECRLMVKDNAGNTAALDSGEVTLHGC